jgi:hypothetical protein
VKLRVGLYVRVVEVLVKPIGVLWLSFWGEICLRVAETWLELG